MILYFNNNSIISITKAKPVSDLIYNTRINKRDTVINSHIDLQTINKILIDYCIKNYIGEEHRPNAMYTVPIKNTIINIYKHKDDILRSRI